MNFTSPRAVFFLALFLYLLLQVYLFRRLRDAIAKKIRRPLPERYLVRGAFVFFLLMFLPFVWIGLFGLLPIKPYPWPIRVEVLLLAIWALGSTGSALVLLSYDLFKRAARRLPKPAEALDFERRRFLKTGAGLVAAAPFVFSGYGVLIGRRRFEIERFDVPLNGLSGALDGLRVVQLTDIHVGPFMPPEELARYVDSINRLAPDVVALTGDFISSSPAEVAPCVEVLATLKARYGVYACLGNHDAYARVEDEITRRFTEKGVRVLRNDAVTHRIGDTTLNILGIDDLRWGAPDFPAARRAAANDPGEVRLLLSHRPEIFPEAAKSGVEVILSGHYHGGQVKFGPESANLSVARLITPYPEGMFLLPRRRRANGAAGKNSVLFVGRGIGITGLPIRVNCPPQIAHLTLKRA